MINTLGFMDYDWVLQGYKRIVSFKYIAFFGRLFSRSRNLFSSNVFTSHTCRDSDFVSPHQIRNNWIDILIVQVQANRNCRPAPAYKCNRFSFSACLIVFRWRNLFWANVFSYQKKKEKKKMPLASKFGILLWYSLSDIKNCIQEPMLNSIVYYDFVFQEINL